MRKITYLLLGITLIISPLTFLNNETHNSDATIREEVSLEEYYGSKALPSGYTECEYLEGDGSSYMKTGLFLDGSDRYDFDLKYEILEGNLQYTSIFGFLDYSKAGFYNEYESTRLLLDGPNGYIHFYYNNLSTEASGSIGYNTNKVRTFTLRSNCFSEDGIRYRYFTSTRALKKMPGEIHLFSHSGSKCFIGRIFHFKIWDSGSLTRYYVPCKNPLNEYGFYDLINHTFLGNSGDGTFTGKEKPQHNHGEDVKDSIPLGYQVLDYLKNTESNIETGIYGDNKNLNYDITLKVDTQSIPWPTVFSNYVDEQTNNTRLIIYTDSNNPTHPSYHKFFANLDTKAGSGSIFYGETLYSSVYNLKFGKKFGCIENDEEISTPETVISKMEDSSRQGKTNHSTIKLFRNGTFSIYDLKIYENDELIAHFVPVKNENAEYGFYDVVRQSFHKGNSSPSSSVCNYCETYSAENYVKYTTSEGDVIYPKNNTLYLPSGTNYSSMNGLSFQKGTILKCSSSSTLTVGDENLDLTYLFGEMVSGKNYRLYFEEGLIKGSINVIKSSQLSSLFLTLNDTFYKVHDNKELVLNGSCNKYSSSNTLTNSCEISKFKGRGNWSWETVNERKPYNINLGKKADLINCGLPSKKWALINHLCENRDERPDANGSWIGAHFGIWDELFKSMNPEYNMDYEYIDLYINGDYRGNYMLMERITADRFDLCKNKYETEDETNTTTTIIQSDGVGLDKTGDDIPDETAFSWFGGLGGSGDLPLIFSTDMDYDASHTIKYTKEQDAQDKAISAGIQAYKFATDSVVEEGGYGGYIIEFARNYYSDLRGRWTGFITRRGQPFTLKSPENANQKQVQTISTFVQELEDALCSESGFNSKGVYYSEYIDIESFAKQYVIHTAMSDTDFLATSTFLFIDVDADTGELKGKLHGDVAWDLQMRGGGSEYLLNKNGAFAKCRANLYLEMFLMHGDFVNELYEQTKSGTTFEETYSNISTIYADLIDSLEDSSMMSVSRYNCILYKTYAEYKSSLIQRIEIAYSHWYNDWFNPSKNLLGITLKQNGSSIKASVTAMSGHDDITWYRVNDDGSLVEETSAAGYSFKPSANGNYVAATTGNNIGYNPSYGYENSLLNSLTIQMVSNPINYRVAKYSSDYDSLNAALADTVSGDLLIVDEDYSIQDATYTIKKGVIVDLFGSSIINADSFIVKGSIIDTKSEKGIISSDTYLFQGEQEYLPVYDTLRDGYSFFDVTIEEQLTTANKLQFRMNKSSEDCNAALDLIGNDIEGSKVKAQVSVTYTKDDGAGKTTEVTETFTFNDEWMEYIIFGSGKDPVKTYKRVLNFTIGNLSELEIVGDIYMQCSFVTYCGDDIIASVKGTKWKTSNLGESWVIGD